MKNNAPILLTLLALASGAGFVLYRFRSMDGGRGIDTSGPNPSTLPASTLTIGKLAPMVKPVPVMPVYTTSPGVSTTPVQPVSIVKPAPNYQTPPIRELPSRPLGAADNLSMRVSAGTMFARTTTRLQ